MADDSGRLNAGRPRTQDGMNLAREKEVDKKLSH
jgi:hypothetical protein